MTVKHRLFVLTDIENEPDDTQSLVRLLLYSNEIDIEGLVAVTSTWMRHQVCPATIRDVISGYDAVRPKLLRVYSDYPPASQLLAVVGEGVPLYGMEGVGEGHDSQGSEALIAAVDRGGESGRPLHVALWGGANCLAQSLWKVRATRTPKELEDFVGRMTVYGISDQDDAGPWIRRNFPMLPYTVSVHGENDYMGSTWIGFSGQPRNGLPGADKSLISADWIRENVQYGPLGSKYPDVIYGMEGDTPSYLNLIQNGLGDPSRPDFGGWGGRYKRIFDPEARHYHDTCDTVTASDGSTQASAGATIFRWRDAVQCDLATRMRWTVEEDMSKLELPPVVVVDGDRSTDFVTRKVKCSETIELDASDSASPSGAKLSFSWFQYKEIGSTLPVPVDVPTFDMHGTANTSKLSITMPKTTAHSPGKWRMDHENGRVYHVILAVTSEGKIPVTRYRRILLDVSP